MNQYISIADTANNQQIYVPKDIPWITQVPSGNKVDFPTDNSSLILSQNQ